MKTERVSELKAKMSSLEKDVYQKSEVLDELFELQREIVRLTFNQDNEDIAKLRIWDVERHLKKKNEELGNVADVELEKFIEGSKTFCNLIKAEVSGNRGEYKAFRTLEYIKSKNYVLKNVELSDGDLRTEIDAVVITPSVISIVEVKNTAKDIFIDELGNYYRTGEFLRFDSDIEGKMQIKEELLRKALSKAGYADIDINSVVVFTNSRIEVQNKCEGLKTCFLSQLSYKVEGDNSETIFSDSDMDDIKTCIEDAENKEGYPLGFDVEQYKTDYAILMAKLEEASEKDIEENVVVEESINKAAYKKVSFREVVKTVFNSRYTKLVGEAVASLATPVVVSSVTSAVIRSGRIL